MTLSNWLGIGVMAIIIITGITVYLIYRRKFERMDGFEGFVSENGKRPRREDFDWMKAEQERLEKELKEKEEIKEENKRK